MSIPDFSVAGRIVCVTGASSGIGQALSHAFEEAGAQIIGVARRKIEGMAAVQADLCDLSACSATAQAVSSIYGPPDIVINAAGLNPRKTADQVTLEEWTRTIDLNLSAPFFFAQALVPGMKTKGWGRIINIASLQSERAFPAGAAYGASKGGVTQLTRAMAEAWSPAGVTANAIAPGFFPTELTSAVFDDPERAARNAAQTCIGRNGRLEDLIGPVFFLCSPASDYVTGQILFVDGGFTAK